MSLSPEVRAAVNEATVALNKMTQDRDDLIVLIAFMAEQGYNVRDVAYAVEKPWKHEDVLIEAKAALEVERENDRVREVGRLRRIENLQEEMATGTIVTSLRLVSGNEDNEAPGIDPIEAWKKDS